ERGDREPSRVREEVQDGAATREGPQASAVVALVQEKAGLLARRDVGEKTESIFGEGDEGTTSVSVRCPLAPPLSRGERKFLRRRFEPRLSLSSVAFGSRAADDDFRRREDVAGGGGEIG